MHLETTVRQPAAARLPFGRAPATCSLLQTVKPWFCGSLMSVLDQLATGPNLSIFSEKRVSYSLLGSETEKKNKGKKKKKKYSGKIEWCRLVLFVQKKKASAICSVWQRVAVCSFYLSFSVLTENPDAQNGHNNQSVQSKLCYYPILVYPFSWEVLFSRSIWLMNGFLLGFLFCKNILAFTYALYICATYMIVI